MTDERPYVSFQEVKEKITLPDVLEALGIADRFQQKGEALVGCCPMPRHVHGPSPNPGQFRMDCRKKIWLWRCFGDCDQGGDVIRFVEEYLQLGSAHARFWFAEHFGDRLTLRKPAKTKQARGESLLPAQAQKQNFQHPTVLPCDPELKPLTFRLHLETRDNGYLEERGVKPETARRYGLGLCQRGLLRDYLAIPIHRWPQESPDEPPVAYLGRYPGEEFRALGLARYKWPEGFPKSRIVYGLREALESAVGSPLIVVEGCFAVFHLVQAGFPNTVALCGSDLSETQADLLLATNRPLILLLDGDEAGLAGSRKAAARLITRQFVRVLKLENGQAPDDLTAEALREQLAH